MEEINEIEDELCEIDESQLKELGIEVQEHLLNKFREQAEREQERCKFIRNANLNTKAEITGLRKRIASLLSHQNTIKEMNNELKKDLILSEVRKQQQIVKFKNAIKKYDELWLESKARFESLHFVQKLMKAQEQLRDVEQQIKELENEEKNICEEMKIKIKNCRELDRKSIIEFAEFMVVERPKYIKLIQERSAAIKELDDKLKALEPKTSNKITKPGENGQKADNACASLDNDNVEDETRDLTSGSDRIILPPTQFLDATIESQLNDSPKEDHPVASEQNSHPERINTIIIEITPPHKITETDHSNSVKSKDVSSTKDDLSVFVEYIANELRSVKGEKNLLVAKKKILDLIFEVKMININDSRPETNVCTVYAHDKVFTAPTITTATTHATPSTAEKKVSTTISCIDTLHKERCAICQKVSKKHKIPEEIDEADEASTYKNMSATEEPSKKKVKFDLPNNEEAKDINDLNNPENEDEIDANLTINSQADVNDDEFAKIKDMTLKQHNLDSSPQFVSGKNTNMKVLYFVNPSSLLKLVESVTSKYFPQEPEKENTEINSQVVENIAIEEDQAAADVGAIPKKGEDDPVVQGILRKDTVFSTKSQKVPVPTQFENPFRDFQFRQNIQMTSDYKDESANASVFADTDEIPTCSGMLKPGLSILGPLPPELQTDSTHNQKAGPSGFSFNLGG